MNKCVIFLISVVLFLLLLFFFPGLVFYGLLCLGGGEVTPQAFCLSGHTFVLR